MNGAYYGEAPAIIKDFLSYMETIRGKSKTQSMNTIMI